MIHVHENNMEFLYNLKSVGQNKHLQTPSIVNMIKQKTEFW